MKGRFYLFKKESVPECSSDIDIPGDYTEINIIKALLIMLGKNGYHYEFIPDDLPEPEAKFYHEKRNV